MPILSLVLLFRCPPFLGCLHCRSDFPSLERVVFPTFLTSVLPLLFPCSPDCGRGDELVIGPFTRSPGPWLPRPPAFSVSKTFARVPFPHCGLEFCLFNATKPSPRRAPPSAAPNSPLFANADESNPSRTVFPRQINLDDPPCTISRSCCLGHMILSTLHSIALILSLYAII